MFQSRLCWLALLACVPACAERPVTSARSTDVAPSRSSEAPKAPADTPPDVVPMPREVPARDPVENTRANEGRQLFLKLQCANCHSGKAGAKAPNLGALYGSKVALKGGAETTADEAYLAESVRKPKAKVVDGWEPIMPAYDETQATAEEVNALVAYLKSLKNGAAPKADRFPPPVGPPTGK